MGERALSIGFVLPYGEPSDGFFADTLPAQLCAQADPRGAAMGAVTRWVRGLEQRTGGDAHRVVNLEAVGAELDERECAQRAEQLGRGFQSRHRTGQTK